MGVGRPAWVEVDLAAITENTRRVRRLVGHGCGVIAVVKANGYGHGLVEASRAALAGGAEAVAVALTAEAAALRRVGITAPILVLGAALPEEADELVGLDASATVAGLEMARALSRAAERRGGAARVHLKVDTGMGRVGVRAEDAPSLLRSILTLPGVAVEAVCTHFATADEADLEYAREQWRTFSGCLARLREEGTLPGRAHAANSAAALRLPEARCDLVRPGLLIYGVPPFPSAERDLALVPALQLKARIALVKDLPEGASIGYGRAYRLQRPGRIAIVPLGYGDGFSRRNSDNGEVLLRGRRAPIRGRICMDQFMVDVTDIPDARVGDEAVLIGRQGDQEITVAQVAGRTDTITHETLSALTERLPRRYVG